MVLKLPRQRYASSRDPWQALVVVESLSKQFLLDKMSFSVLCPYCGQQFRKIKPELEGKRARCRCGKTIRLRRSDPEPEKQVDDPFGDLDSILEGAGDTAPIAVETETQSPLFVNVATEPSDKSKRWESVGAMAAFFSATLAVWFGALVVWSRFQVLPQPGLKDYSQQIQSANVADFDRLELSQAQEIMFVSFGWTFWAVALGLVLLGGIQFFNTFSKLLFKLEIFRRVDGLVAALAVAAVFLSVATVFGHQTIVHANHRALNQYEAPFKEQGTYLENVQRLRAEIDQQSQAFTSAILIAGTVPLLVFALSVTRLFVKTDDTIVGTQQSGT